MTEWSKWTSSLMQQIIHGPLVMANMKNRPSFQPQSSLHGVVWVYKLKLRDTLQKYLLLLCKTMKVVKTHERRETAPDWRGLKKQTPCEALSLILFFFFSLILLLRMLLEQLGSQEWSGGLDSRGVSRFSSNFDGVSLYSCKMS